jgi:hypothetical protein
LVSDSGLSCIAPVDDSYSVSSGYSSHSSQEISSDILYSLSSSNSSFHLKNSSSCFSPPPSPSPEHSSLDIRTNSLVSLSTDSLDSDGFSSFKIDDVEIKSSENLNSFSPLISSLSSLHSSDIPTTPETVRISNSALDSLYSYSTDSSEIFLNAEISSIFPSLRTSLPGLTPPITSVPSFDSDVSFFSNSNDHISSCFNRRSTYFDFTNSDRTVCECSSRSFSLSSLFSDDNYSNDTLSTSSIFPPVTSVFVIPSFLPNSSGRFSLGGADMLDVHFLCDSNSYTTLVYDTLIKVGIWNLFSFVFRLYFTSILIFRKIKINKLIQGVFVFGLFFFLYNKNYLVS